jgi:hypothetical protein
MKKYFMSQGILAAKYGGRIVFITDRKKASFLILPVCGFQ